MALAEICRKDVMPHQHVRLVLVSTPSLLTCGLWLSALSATTADVSTRLYFIEIGLIYSTA
jgi:hypothetical protein